MCTIINGFMVVFYDKGCFSYNDFYFKLYWDAECKINKYGKCKKKNQINEITTEISTWWIHWKNIHF